jgi:Immunoglobulin I-set domain
MRAVRSFLPALGSVLSLTSLSVCLLACFAVVSGCSSGGGSGTTPPPAVAPQITTQPAAQSVFVGDTATFSVVASGTAPLTYQWARGGTAITGATSASYTTAALAAIDDGALFTVTVSNSAGSVTSSSAKLSVALHPVTITTQPAVQSVFVGDTAAFMVVATGTAPSYQWQRNGSNISGATSATYVTPALAVTDDGALFTVTVSNAAGSVTSASAKLSVALHPVAITTNPSDMTITDGGTATFNVVATGTPTLTYQWLRGGSPISGATNASYSLTGAAIADSGSLFSVKVTNGAGSVTSSTAKLTVNAAPVTITVQPAGPTQFVGETATFSVTATGTIPTYQWRKNAAAISGATASTYTTPVLAATDDKATFDVLVSNSANSLDSAVVTLHVGPFATSYATQQGKVLSLYAWPGSKDAFLTKTATLDPVSMRKILNAADATWNYYAGAVGRLPSIFLNYNGLATTADTGIGGVDLCGDGCTYIGATGMEISDNAFALLYNGVQNNTYDQVIFYEFGRSFWLMGSQLEYKAPAVSSCEVTGFAVLMRYRSLQAEGLTGSFNGTAANYTSLYNNTLGMIDTYAANTSLNFNNTFLTDSFSSPYGGCADLWTSMMLRLAQNYGGEAFIQNVFKEALKRPAAVTTQDAVDNFILAASAAANANLTLVFQNQWRWPVSTAASAEAMTRWGKPV